MPPAVTQEAGERDTPHSQTGEDDRQPANTRGRLSRVRVLRS